MVVLFASSLKIKRGVSASGPNGDDVAIGTYMLVKRGASFRFLCCRGALIVLYLCRRLYGTQVLHCLFYLSASVSRSCFGRKSST